MGYRHQSFCDGQKVAQRRHPMLKSYSAEISGSQLVWIDQPPPNLTRQPVLIVIENSAPQADTTQHYDLTDLVGRLTWQGDATQVQRGLRDAW